MMKLEHRQDTVRGLYPITLVKVKRKRQRLGHVNLRKASVKKLPLLFIIEDPIQNLFIHSHPSEKKQEVLLMDQKLFQEKEELIK